MATEINKLASSNLVSTLRLSQDSVPSKNLVNQQTEQSVATPKTDNIVPLAVSERQNVAASESPNANPTSSNQLARASLENSQDALSDISRAVQTIQRNLEFKIDEASGRTVITVKDSESNEVIRQIPSDQLLELSARLQEIETQKRSNSDIDAQGVLFTTKT